MATDQTPNLDGYVHESPFAELLDMRVRDPDDGSSVVVMPINARHLQQAGRVQGGIVVALADFLAAAQNGELTATAKIISPGRRLMVGEMEVKDQDGKLIAQGLGTYMVLRPRT